MDTVYNMMIYFLHINRMCWLYIVYKDKPYDNRSPFGGLLQVMSLAMRDSKRSLVQFGGRQPIHPRNVQPPPQKQGFDSRP